MNIRLASFLLRIGIALSLLYAAIASFLSPLVWSSFFPYWITNIISGTTLLTIFSIGEILLALWLLSHQKICAAGLVTAILMLLIIVANYHSLDLVFREIHIMFGGLALVAIHKNDV